MGLLDDIKNKAADLAKDPDTKQKIEDFAKEHNVTIEEAKKKLTNRGDDK